jgi:hypothetical protein
MATVSPKPPTDARAILLAASITAADAEALQAQGLVVHTFVRPPSLRELAAAALDLRKRYPRLPLIVAGPQPLIKNLEQRYPPLIDVPLVSAEPEMVLAALATTQR